MVRIGDVWDSTMDAVRGRARIIAPVALLAFFLPGVIQNGIAAYAAPTPGTMGLTAVVALATVIAAVWGQLAIIAIATDPATTRAEAMAQAGRRFGPAIGAAALLALIALGTLIPFAIALGYSGIDWVAISRLAPGAQPDLSGASPTAILFAFLYLLVWIGFALWLSARAILVYAVALNERRGAGAIGRGMALTRGLTLKIIGLLLLYAVVLGVVTLAVQGIIFLALRVPLGEGMTATATFLGAVAGGLVSSALVAVFCVFTARLYVATAGVPTR